MLDEEIRRRPLTVEQLARVGDAIAPGTRVVAAEPLPGGIATATYHLRTTSGDHVLRVYRGSDERDPVRACRAAHDVLASVSRATRLAPRPVVGDPDGRLVGEPVLVTTYFGGAPLAPDGSASWTEQLADALVEIHGAPLARLERVTADKTPRERVDRVKASPPETHDPLWEEAVAMLDARADAVRPNPRTLIHADLWFGNTVWRDGRLVGVIDWDSARIGDPARDVACARADLRLRPGDEQARVFLEHYEARRGPLSDIAFWDLLADLGPLRWLAHFLQGYIELGAPLSMDEGRRRAERAVRADLDTLR
ncbi:MAG TPA: phosphotransferase [Candidatus Limnocylindria bacterium]|nr:phosphotransferase [Candidatus Limnocylindria bacterium]